jgi:D-alanyl-D-alanine carboxypeptidase
LPRANGRDTPLGGQMNRTRPATIAAVCCLLLVLPITSSCTSGSTTQPPVLEEQSNLPPAVQDTAKLETAIDKVMKANDIPGVLFAVTKPGASDTVIAKGVSDIETSRAVSPQDRYRIGSVTKTFTSTVLLQLAGEGKVSLDDPVSTYAPQVPNGKNITVRMLLNHTSGIFSYTEDRAS